MTCTYIIYNNNYFILSILLIVVLHVYNGNKRHIKRAMHNQYVPYNKKSVKVLIKNRCKVSYSNVFNPQISCVRTALVLE